MGFSQLYINDIKMLAACIKDILLASPEREKEGER